MSKSPNNSLIGAGVLAAIASSLCCIVPVVAAVASISGIAASFSWLEPARPFLIGFTVLVLGFAWYQHMKNKKAQIDCDCEPDGPRGGDDKPSFFQSTKFMGIITVFAGLMLAFPYYSGAFFPALENGTNMVSQENIAEAKLEIEGMTCESCTSHIQSKLQDSPIFCLAGLCNMRPPSSPEPFPAEGTCRSGGPTHTLVRSRRVAVLDRPNSSTGPLPILPIRFDRHWNRRMSRVRKVVHRDACMSNYQGGKPTGREA